MTHDIETNLLFAEIKILLGFDVMGHKLNRYMWLDQEEWVGCRGYWFWDIGKNSVPIPLFYIVFSIEKFFITLQPDIQL